MIEHEPYKIKSVRNIRFSDLNERKRELRQAGFNTGRIPASRVSFDMVAQGSSAMSQDQIGGLFLGDEAYAGSRNFYRLTDAVRDVFGLEYTCPVHNRFGGMKLLCSIHAGPGRVAGGNTLFPEPLVSCFGGAYQRFSASTEEKWFEGPDLGEVSDFLESRKGKVSFLYIDLQGDEGGPVSFQVLSELRAMAEAAKTKLVLDGSCITGWAYRLIRQDPSCGSLTVREIVRRVSRLCHILLFDAGQDAMSNTGGLLATDSPIDHERHQNEVVVFEGLHTYGGMAGRTMEVVAAGLREMVDDLLVEWTQLQVTRFAGSLKKKGIPLRRGFNGVYLLTDRILPNIEGDASHPFSAALYLTSGVRAHLPGPYRPNAPLPVLIPRRALMNNQLDEISRAVGDVYAQREAIPAMIPLNAPESHEDALFDWPVPHLRPYIFRCEPYTAHGVEPVAVRTQPEREAAMIEAGYNTFLLKSEDIAIDLLTDSGTPAMSTDQWIRYFGARETPAAPDAYEEVVRTSREIYGYRHVILTHQGRAAEHIMSTMFIEPGDYVPGNMYFTTTKLHQELAGGIFRDVIVDQALETGTEFPWKGNIDLRKLDSLHVRGKEEGKRIAYVSFEFNVNMAGGQPVSMDNIKSVYAYCKAREIPVFFDATRCAENACFIQRNDSRYRDVPVADILLEMFSYGDGATISAKKDMLSNISGSLLFRDNEEWYRKALRLLRIFEDDSRNGGTSAGDMAAHAQGMREMVDDAYINSRIEQTAYLGGLLRQAGIPIVLPPGGHAVFLDARTFLPHIDQDHFPAQMLAAQIFIETGVRTMERGNVSKGRNPETGENFRPELELVRLTIPRRVYSRNHLKAVAAGIIRLYKKRQTIKGLRFTYEPKKLRFFQSRFEPSKLIAS